MTIGFVSNFMNHHQKPLADRLYAALGDGYRWIATTPVDEERLALGYDDLNASLPYVLRTYAGEEERQRARAFCLSCDCLIVAYDFGGLAEERMRLGRMTVITSERVCKRGAWELLRPREYVSTLLHRTRYRGGPLYFLSIGELAARDYRLTFSFPKKCYRWGYFIDVPKREAPPPVKDTAPPLKIFWAARFIDWKHPEFMLAAARRLKAEGYSFRMELAGTGPLFDEIRKKIDEEGLRDRIVLLGAMPHEEVRKKMLEAPVFCLTSNRREGWGAVVSEALASRCVTLASEAVGAATALLADGKSGVLFRDGDSADFTEKLRGVLADPERYESVADRGYATMTELWNPDVAAERLIRWTEAMLAGGETPYQTGPCSFIR
ncbi:MAG: glycosyltransferase family 4 protein [Oscillibacter sp.]|nr:glycosyltransferase family 4 protein [Oscillibacter sp.]